MTAQDESGPSGPVDSAPPLAHHTPYGSMEAEKEPLDTSTATASPSCPTVESDKAAAGGGGEPQTPDQVLGALGSMNPYLLFVWVSMSIVWCLTAMLMMISSFTMGEEQFCEGAGGAGEVESSSFAPSSNHCVSVAIPGTLNEEFDLSGSIVGWATHSAFLIGTCVGSSVLPLLSDAKGRRTVLLWSLTLLGVFGTLSALSVNVLMFIVLRFATGLFFVGCGVTNWVLAYESVPLGLRSYSALSFGLMWVLGYCLVSPLAYLLPDWRTLTMVCSVPSILFAVLFMITIPESFHFLVWRQRKPSITRFLSKANRSNECLHSRRRLSVDVDELCEHAHHCRTAQMEEFFESESSEAASSNNILHHLRANATLRLDMAVMVYLWACNTFVYYGLSLFSDQLKFDRYWKHALIGLVEVPSYLISPFLLNLLGRRYFICVCHLLAAVSLFSINLAPDSPSFNLTMWLVGKFAIASSFTSLFVYASELFPTVVRSGCIGVCSVLARIMGALTPAVTWMAVVNPVLPTLFYGVMSTGAAGLILLLPETLNRELPDVPGQMAKEDGDEEDNDGGNASWWSKCGGRRRNLRGGGRIPSSVKEGEKLDSKC